MANLINEIEKDSHIEIPEILKGFSGKKILKFLCLCSKNLLAENTVYLEVGVFQGLTLLSVGNANPDLQVFGIDNFAYLDKDGKNHSIVKERREKLTLSNVNVINSDYEDALGNLENYIGDKKIGLYFVDGPHDYRSQLMCLLLVKPYLADNAIIVIDDSNYEHVRQANSDFIVSNKEFSLIFEAYTECHPRNQKDIKNASDGWWNGINIIMKQPFDFENQKTPITQRVRDVFESDHLLHSAKYPLAAHQLLDIYSTLKSFRLDKAFMGILKLIFRKSDSKHFIGKHRATNTFSENLSPFKLHI